MTRQPVFTAATLLTLSRLALVVPVTVLTLTQHTLLAAVFFALGAVTDYFDGIVARRFHQVTSLGARLDASIDKVFIYIILVTLAVRGSLTVTIIAVAFARDLLVEVWRQQAALQRRVIPANRWGKSKFLLQCASVMLALLAGDLPHTSYTLTAANALLVCAVVAGLPGVVTVWNISRRTAAA